MSAEFVLEMAWKSTVLAISVLVLLLAMRRQDPSHRAAVGGLGLALLPLLPLIVLAVTVLPVPSIELTAPESTVRAIPVTMDQGAILFPLASPELPPVAAPAVQPEELIGALWVAGALLVLLRLAAGLLTLRRWTSTAERISSPAWNKVMRKCGAPENTALLVSDHVSTPLSWGWRKPVILVDRATLGRREEAKAIIAHEAAHLARLDWPRLLAARLAVALFWFNPLVWLLERRHLQDVEEAADLQATHCVEPTRYAQTLLNVARGRNAPLGANSMACGTLSKRISQILSPRAPSPSGRMWRSGALAGVAMIAGPLAITQFVAPAVSAAVAVAPAAAMPSPAAAAPIAFSAISAQSATKYPERTARPQAAPATVSATQAAPAVAPQPSIIDQEALAQVMKDAEAARAQAEVVSRDAKEMAAQAQAQAAIATREAREIQIKVRKEVAISMANMRSDMLRGADEMERGAVEMRQGAAQMRDEARKLRDPAYRAEQIRKAQARGDHVPTDQELIDAIPKMEEGARKMDAGVEKMREGARRMREQAKRS